MAVIWEIKYFLQFPQILSLRSSLISSETAPHTVHPTFQHSWPHQLWAYPFSHLDLWPCAGWVVIVLILPSLSSLSFEWKSSSQRKVSPLRSLLLPSEFAEHLHHTIEETRSDATKIPQSFCIWRCRKNVYFYHSALLPLNSLHPPQADQAIVKSEHY